MKKIRLVNPIKEMLSIQGKEYTIFNWGMMVVSLIVAIFCFCAEWWLPATIFTAIEIAYVKMVIIDFSWYQEFVDDIED